ncbi:MAG: hypothetical protein A2Y41_06375 [Spirochaetes bacterium GWB1_36_13]|nr:MAG: hypothetical protein A2Y41_06375 [Spirochaetes bacterium GWB1_36_13]
MILMAFRNLFRSKRRSLFLIIAFSFALGIILFSRYFASGTHEASIRQTVILKSGYLQIAANGYLENPSLERAMDIRPEIFTTLESEGVFVYSRRVESAGLLSFNQSSKFVTIVGIDPERETQITEIHRKMVEDKFFENKPSYLVEDGKTVYQIVMGKKLSQTLGLEIGSEIALVTGQFDGSVGAVLARVIGFYQADDTGLDFSTIFLPLDAAHKLFGTYSEEEGLDLATSIVIQAKDSHEAEKIKSRLKEKFPLPHLGENEDRGRSNNYDPVLYDWQELNPGIIQLMNFDQAGTEISLFFIIFILAFGILNIVQMAVFERRREFGILIALGTARGRLFMTFLFEMFFLLLPGIFFGFSIGYGAGYYFYKNPILITGKDAEVFTTSGFAPILKTSLTLSDTLFGILSLIIPVVLFIVLSSLKIFKINPREVISER